MGLASNLAVQTDTIARVHADLPTRMAWAAFHNKS
jgi:hypothetical protein